VRDARRGRASAAGARRMRTRRTTRMKCNRNGATDGDGRNDARRRTD
jgi:hypothetical protein